MLNKYILFSDFYLLYDARYDKISFTYRSHVRSATY